MSGRDGARRRPFRHLWRRVGRRFLILALGVGVSSGGTLTAGDWPQILGPTRNGHAAQETLAESWPAEGPRTLWTHPLGMGYAGPAVVGDSALIFHRRGDEELVEAVDVGTGRSRWQRPFPAPYRGGVDADTGPRCVPLVDGQRVFLWGAAGDLHCVNLADGAPVWSRPLIAEMKGSEGYFGAGSTPLLIRDRLLVNVGGQPEAGVVALDPATGRTLWKATSDDASYSAPAPFLVAGRPQALFVTRLHAVCLDAESGRELFRIPFGKRGPTVNAATPLMLPQDRLLLTASYGIGAVLARFSGTRVETIWANDEALSSQYPTPVFHDGYLYGIHGREDIPPAALRCVEAETGKVQWSEEDFGVAHLILAGDRLLLLSVEGTLTLAQADPTRFRKLAQHRVSSAVTRALPALSNGRLYFRENQGRSGALKCLQVGR